MAAGRRILVLAALAAVATAAYEAAFLRSGSNSYTITSPPALFGTTGAADDNPKVVYRNRVYYAGSTRDSTALLSVSVFGEDAPPAVEHRFGVTTSTGRNIRNLALIENHPTWKTSLLLLADGISTGGTRVNDKLWTCELDTSGAVTVVKPCTVASVQPGFTQFAVMPNGTLLGAAPTANDGVQLVCVRPALTTTTLVVATWTDTQGGKGSSSPKYLTPAGDALLFSGSVLKGNVTATALYKAAVEGADACGYTPTLLADGVEQAVNDVDGFIFPTPGPAGSIPAIRKVTGKMMVVMVDAAHGAVYEVAPASGVTNFEAKIVLGWVGDVALYVASYGSSGAMGVWAAWDISDARNGTDWVTEPVSSLEDEAKAYYTFTGYMKGAGSLVVYDAQYQTALIGGYEGGLIAMDVTKLLDRTLAEGARLPAATLAATASYDLGSYPKQGYTAGKWLLFHADKANSGREGARPLMALDTTTGQAAVVDTTADWAIHDLHVLPLPGLSYAAARVVYYTGSNVLQYGIAILSTGGATVTIAGYVSLAAGKSALSLAEETTPSTSNLAALDNNLYWLGGGNLYSWPLPAAGGAGAPTFSYSTLPTVIANITFTSFNPVATQSSLAVWQGALWFPCAASGTAPPELCSWVPGEEQPAVTATAANPTAITPLPLGLSGTTMLFFTAQSNAGAGAEPHVLRTMAGVPAALGDICAGTCSSAVWGYAAAPAAGAIVFIGSNGTHSNLYSWEGGLTETAAVLYDRTRVGSTWDATVTAEWVHPAILPDWTAADGSNKTTKVAIVAGSATAYNAATAPYEPATAVWIVDIGEPSTPAVTVPRPARWLAGMDAFWAGNAPAAVTFLTATTDGTAYFDATTVSSGRELYKVTAAGGAAAPAAVANVNPGAGYLYPHQFLPLPSVEVQAPGQSNPRNVSIPFLSAVVEAEEAGLTVSMLGLQARDTTVSPTPSPSASNSPSPIPTISNSPSASVIPTPAASVSVTASPSGGVDVASPSPSASASASAAAGTGGNGTGVSPSPSPSASGTPTPSITPSPSASPVPIARVVLKLSLPPISPDSLTSSGAGLALRGFIAETAAVLPEAVLITGITYFNRTDATVLLSLNISKTDPLNLAMGMNSSDPLLRMLFPHVAAAAAEAEEHLRRQLQNQQIPTGPDVGMQVDIIVVAPSVAAASAAKLVFLALLAEPSVLVNNTAFAAFTTALCTSGGADCSNGVVYGVQVDTLIRLVPAPAAEEASDPTGAIVGAILGVLVVGGLVTVGVLAHKGIITIPGIPLGPNAGAAAGAGKTGAGAVAGTNPWFRFGRSAPYAPAPTATAGASAASAGSGSGSSSSSSGSSGAPPSPYGGPRPGGGHMRAVLGLPGTPGTGAGSSAAAPALVVRQAGPAAYGYGVPRATMARLQKSAFSPSSAV